MLLSQPSSKPLIRLKPILNPKFKIKLNPPQPYKLKFIDLFCGIGGFHVALKNLGCECVLACDIDSKCREVYEDNFNLTPLSNIRDLDLTQCPDFDILCAGFPCQPFSHAGNQVGFQDQIRGTLFYEIIKILQAKQPKYFILENVKNLRGHDNGKTLKVILNSLIQVGYHTYEEPILVSPLHFGIPQNRERVFIIGIRKDVGNLKPFPQYHKRPTSLYDIIDPISDPSLELSSSQVSILNRWEIFIQYFQQKDLILPTFPIWTEDFDSQTDITALPEWKRKFIDKNREFYNDHKQFLEPWLLLSRSNSRFKGSLAKLEWQCGHFKLGDSLWNLLFQFRPSGIRIKRTDYSPALVAMAQIVYVGKYRRKLSPKEVSRLQSFPSDFKFHTNTNAAYKQFGNSVNVKVVQEISKHLLN